MAPNSRFVWDSRKSAANLRKHGVDFEIVKEVFGDPLREIVIEGHEHGEERWRIVGHLGPALMVISYTWIETDEEEIFRIISARKATPQERRRYERER